MPNPSDILARFLSADKKAWVVVETKLLNFYLTQSLGADFPHVSVITRGELYRSLPFIEPSEETSESSLTELCFRFIKDEDFPILRSETGIDGSASLSFSFRALTPIVEFVEAYLCYDDHTDVYRALTDQFGDVKGESERFAELVRLADIISANGGASAMYMPGLLSESDKRRVQSALPGQLVFYLPTNFLPLERHFLESISKLTEISFVIDRGLFSDSAQLNEVNAPSERFLNATYCFVDEFVKSGRGRVVDISGGGEGQTTQTDLTAILDGIGFKTADSRLDHVSIVEIDGSESPVVADLIVGLLKSGQCAPSDIVVVALDESCGGALSRLLREREVEVVEPRGRAITDTPYPALFRAYVEWLIEPSITTFENFYLSPQIQSSFEVRAATSLIHASALDVKIFARESLGISEEVQRQLFAVNDLAGKSVSDEVLSRGIARINQELQSTERSIGAARKKFHKLRCRLKQLISGENELDKTTAARALRKFSSIVRREAAAMGAFAEGKQSDVGLLRAFELRVRSAAASSYLNQEVSYEAVIVTQLLDARSLQGKTVVIASSVETNFFGTRASIGESVTASMDLRLKRSVGAELPGAEALAILRGLLHGSRKLYFTFSNSDGRPPRFLERLSAYSNQDVDKLDHLLKSGDVVNPELTKGARLLLSRSSHEFTEYDGIVGSEALAMREFPHSYSVSDIQTLSDCRHKFFFAKFLRLSEIHSNRQGLVGRISGTLTHALLRRRFGGDRNVDTFFSEYQLPWDLPEYRQMQQLILNLYLPTAERLSERLGTAPLMLEESFRGDKAFVIEGIQRSISITGMIDRVDLLEEREDRKLVTVWDYKTSPPYSLQKRNAFRELQVPLYALAVNSMGPYEVVGGGLLLLNFPGLDEDDFASVDKGPIRDQLRLNKAGNKWVIDPGSVGDKLTNVTQTVRDLAELVATGRLHQSTKTDDDVCRYCDFQRICARDEVVLEQKEKQLPISVSSLPLPTTNSIYRLYFNRYVEPVERKPSSSQQAAGEVGNSFVVHAGAGAGKTATIVHRILSLLLAGNSISSIVTVTFTKKAAAELKERLKSAIAGAIETSRLNGKDLGANEIGLLSEAFYGVEKAQIGTIHSFCHSVLATSPNISREFYRSEILEESRLRELGEQTVVETVANLSPAILNSFFAARFKLNELKGGIRDLLMAPTELSALKTTYLAPENTSKALIEKLVSYHAASIQSAADKLIDYLDRWLRDVTVWMIGSDLKEQQRADFKTLINFGRQLLETHSMKAVSAEFCEAYAALSDFADRNSKSQKVKTKSNPVNYWKELRDELEKFDGRFLSTDSLARVEKELFAQSRSIIEVADRAAAIFKSYKVENGVASFDDIISAVHDFFDSEHGEIPLIRRSTKHVLIDEFQDTDVVQWEIFKRLTPETMFIVGDYQQAIYGFRGGELSVFELAEREIIEAGGKRIGLDDNYRSLPSVINFVNGFFNDLFRSDGEDAAVTARAMQPVRPAEDHDLEGAFVINGTSRDQVEEANNTAAIVATLLQRKPGSEIAVIARTSKQIRMLCGGLTRASIPYVVLHSGDFYDREEIKLFQNLFAWLGQPENDIALVGILRSALFAYSDDDLLKTFCSAESGWPKDGQLARLQTLARSYSVVELIEFLLNKLDLKRTYNQAGDNIAIANISLLQSQLRDAAKSGLNIFCPLTVARWLERRPAISKDAVSSARGEGQVKILTIHGAKGLEFSNVILPFLERRAKRQHDFILGKFEGATLLGLKVADSDSEVRTKTMTQRLLDEQNTLQEKAEERRVFYVACTRARDTLILNSPFNEERPPIESALAECAQSFNSVVWIKQLVQPGDAVVLHEQIALRRAGSGGF